MSKDFKINKKIIAFFFAIILLTNTMTVYAATFSDNYEEEGQSLVNHILGSGLNATNVVKKGTVYTFSNGKDDVGIESGIILDTSGSGGVSENDSDLASIMDYPYGGHTSSLEFTLTATGTFLNFNYVFASNEFQYGEQFNDVFGLFVSVNGGEYEDIAKITTSSGQQVPVNITNLKANPEFYTAKSLNGKTTDGVSVVLNAQKEVNKGDIVKIKFVIADVSDTEVDSYVMIESGSLSFDAPTGKIDYTEEALKDLDPNAIYKIIDGDKTYELTSDDEGKVPLVGKDNNNKNYNFIGKTLQIIKKGIDDIPDSEPQEITIDNRPNVPDDISPITQTPKDIEITDVEVSQTEIKILSKEGQEYSIDGKTWKKANNNGYVVFSNLEPNKEYTIYTRVAATNNSLASEQTKGTKIVTKNMVKQLNYDEHNYEGDFDGKKHYAYVSSDEDVDIKYSETLYGTYESNVINYVLPGTYTVYYSIEKEGYYPAYGSLTVKINGQGTIKIINNESQNSNEAKIIDTSEELISKINFTEDELTKIKNGQSIEIFLEVKDISESVSADDKEKIEAKLGKDTLAMYLDINLYKQVEGEEATKITKTKQPVTISFIIPEKYINTDSNVTRTFKVFRLHEGKVTEIEVKINGNVGTFETDEFSTYALAYTDTIITSNPQTGDNIISYILLLGLSIIGLISALIYTKNKKFN